MREVNSIIISLYYKESMNKKTFPFVKFRIIEN